MTVKSRIIQRGKLNLCLPVFSSEDTEEFSIINSFYEDLAKEISAYAESHKHIRRYSADFSTVKNDDLLNVKLNLNVRILNEHGETKIHRREICTSWKGVTFKITVNNIK